jgi:hypothetical protein
MTDETAYTPPKVVYEAGEFLQVADYKNVQRWTDTIAGRPAVKRGRMVTASSATKDYFAAMCRNIWPRASSSISVLNVNRSFNAFARCAAGRALI